MEVSSTSMNAARATVAAMSHGLTRGFHCAVSAPLGLTIVLAGAEPAGAGGSVCNSGKTLSSCGLLPVFGCGEPEAISAALCPAMPPNFNSTIDVHSHRRGSRIVGSASQCGTWRSFDGWLNDGHAPADESDGQRNKLHDNDKRDTCRPLAEGPESSRNNTGSGAAEIVAGDVDTRGSDACSRRCRNAQMALRSGLRNEDACRKHSEPKNNDRQQVNEGEQHAGNGAADSSANAGAEADAGNEVSGPGSDDETDQVDKEERAQCGDG